jgi:hypothetical protein
MIEWTLIIFFKREEFDSPDAPGSGEAMDKQHVFKLELMRLFLKRPIIINSGVRTPKYNKKKGGKDDSEHLDGHGSDIKAVTSREKYEIVTSAYSVGFRRIGIYKRHIHLGSDPIKPQEVIWYGTYKKRKPKATP